MSHSHPFPDPRTKDPISVKDWVGIASPRTELLHGFEYDLRAREVTARHAEVAVNSAVAIKSALVRSGVTGCVARAAEPLVAINEYTAHVPDVSVECNRPESLGDYFIEPCLVVEILSTHTRYYDLTTKLSSYFTLPYLTQVLIIDPIGDLVQVHWREEQRTRVFDTRTQGLIELNFGGVIEVAELLA